MGHARIPNERETDWAFSGPGIESVARGYRERIVHRPNADASLSTRESLTQQARDAKHKHCDLRIARQIQISKACAEISSVQRDKAGIEQVRKC